MTMVQTTQQYPIVTGNDINVRKCFLQWETEAAEMETKLKKKKKQTNKQMNSK